MAEPRTLVIIEDEYLISYFLEDACRQAGWVAAGMTDSAEDGLKMIREVRPEVALIDIRLSGPRDGVELASQVMEEQPDLKVIFVTGSVEPEVSERMAALSPSNILIKPIQSPDLIAALEAA